MLYPRASHPWPELERAFADQALAALGVQWDLRSGVVPRSGSSFYRSGQATAADVNSSDADIAFYARANPGQAQGDTLVCMAPISPSNLAGVLDRMLRGRRASRP